MFIFYMQSFLNLKGIIISVSILGIVDIITSIYNSKNRKKEIRYKVAKILFYLTVSFLIGFYIIFSINANKGYEFLTSYILEYSMTIDNLFAFIVIFNRFGLKRDTRINILNIGIISIIIFRILAIHYGMIILEKYSFMILFMALALIYSAFKIGIEIAKSSKTVEVIEVIENKKKLSKSDIFKIFTLIVASDVIFSIDSISVAVGITKDEQIIILSNILSLLGLSSLYCVIDEVIKKTKYAKHILVMILLFVGTKIFVEYFGILHINPLSTMIFVTLLIILSFIYQKLTSKKDVNNQRIAKKS
jgi:tellurite resistance protein TerC